MLIFKWDGAKKYRTAFRKSLTDLTLSSNHSHVQWVPAFL